MYIYKILIQSPYHLDELHWLSVFYYAVSSCHSVQTGVPTGRCRAV